MSTRKRSDEDFDREIRAHIEIETERLIEDGMPRADALSRLVRAGGGTGSIWDPALYSFVLPVLIVAVVGALATWIPSRRALKIDPVVLLRTQ
jgi:hypothetical protein